MRFAHAQSTRQQHRSDACSTRQEPKDRTRRGQRDGIAPGTRVRDGRKRRAAAKVDLFVTTQTTRRGQVTHANGRHTARHAATAKASTRASERDRRAVRGQTPHTREQPKQRDQRGGKRPCTGEQDTHRDVVEMLAVGRPLVGDDDLKLQMRTLARIRDRVKIGSRHPRSRHA